VKFGYTILYVKDVQKTVTFYESAVGLRRKFVHESGYGEMDTGETALAFASVELATANGVPFVPANHGSNE
jgi:lactoylglutathione lyase